MESSLKMKPKLIKLISASFLSLALALINLSPITASPYSSVNLKIGHGRISLIDIGAMINDEPVVVNPDLVNVYLLSGLEDENSKSIIAIQGLKKSGSTDLSVNTTAGVKSFHLELIEGEGEDYAFYPQFSRVRIHNEYTPIFKERMTVVSLDDSINEYVLAGNPNLVELKHLCNPQSKEFLRLFGINSKIFTGRTDLVIATRSGVHKLKLLIQKDNPNAHTANLNLAWNY